MKIAVSSSINNKSYYRYQKKGIADKPSNAYKSCSESANLLSGYIPFVFSQNISFKGSKHSFINMLKGRYSFSDEQANFIHRNNIEDYPKINASYFDSDIANLFLNSEQKDRFLRNKENFNLKFDENFGVIAYDLTEEQIQNYTNLKSQHEDLALSELILISKAELTNTQISRYLEIKTKEYQYKENQEQKTYKLTIDEAVLLSKNDFNDAQIKTFAELRNMTIDLRDDSIREIGGTQNLPAEFIISRIRHKKSKEAIIREYEMSKIADYKNSFELSLGLSDTQRKRYEKIKFEPSQKEFDEFTGLIDQFSGGDIKEAIKSPDFQKILNAIYKFDIASLSDKEYRMYKKLISAGLNKYLAASACRKFDDEHYLEFKKHKAQGKTATDAFHECGSNPELEKILKNKSLSLEEKMDLLSKWYERSKEYIFANKIKTTSPAQQKRYYEMLKQGFDFDIAFRLSSMTEEQKENYDNFSDSIKTKPWAFDLAQMTKEQYRKYNIISQDKEFETELHHFYCGFGKNNPLDIVNLTDDKFKQFMQIKKELYQSNQPAISYSMIYDIVKNNDISSFPPEILRSFSENLWYIINTGENKEVYDTINIAIKEFSANIGNLKFTPLQTPVSDDNGNINHNGYSINIQQAEVNSKPVLFIKDNNSDEKFIAFNGAVVRVNSAENFNGKQKFFNSHCNLLLNTQRNVLANAANMFIINLFNEKENCLYISQGLGKIPPVVAGDMTTSETKKFYGNLYKALSDRNKLSVINILKLIPLDSILMINPYATTDSGNMLYSISCEWNDSDGKKWQMRVHSQDLKYPSLTDSSNWITRIGYEGDDGETNYLQFDNSTKGYNFDGEHSGALSKDSHIEIKTPVKNCLINNIDFQKEIRELSSQIYSSYSISAIAEKLKINSGITTDKEKIEKIISSCIANPFYYLQFKEPVDTFRENLGRINLNNI